MDKSVYEGHNRIYFGSSVNTDYFENLKKDLCQKANNSLS